MSVCAAGGIDGGANVGAEGWWLGRLLALGWVVSFPGWKAKGISSAVLTMGVLEKEKRKGRMKKMIMRIWFHENDPSTASLSSRVYVCVAWPTYIVEGKAALQGIRSSRGDMVGCGELSCISGESVSMKLLKLGLGKAGEIIMELMPLPGCWSCWCWCCCKCWV